ncbi:hypothetical protein [Gloeobacter violaceus]|uniref:Gsl0429 protein n=1 Tax=Gloeobacter violaceus (strain ATCC 29082 / PCC 7421) TaxID=251221 RepID=Q7NNI2_GLOVI|nr:hypothetical protein [Gloeobacter violaceus]BAC88370.1 gsl0429 [Gloeobacter violaceus PCC 7421]
MDFNSKPPQLETRFHASPVQAPAAQAHSAAGTAAGAALQTRNKQKLALMLQAGKVLKSHLVMRRLSDRVYELMRDELDRHRERGRDYGGHF